MLPGVQAKEHLPLAGQSNVPTVSVAQNPTLGPILTDPFSNPPGRTLYVHTLDIAGHSTCDDACLAQWPAFILPPDNSVTPLPGLPGLLSTTGAKQVTYNNLPLYLNASDHNVGDTNGLNTDSTWLVATP
jgi:predicted lipoprotein with Yx(FWY)xxD motif